MTRSLWLFAALLTAAPAAAQSDTAAVMAPIQRLFDGMRAADSAMVRSAFHPDARFVRVDTRGDTARVTVDDIERFVAAVGGATAVWDERLFDTEVRIDGAIASVWTGYTFRFGERFSHCGVDSFELVRAHTGWLIIHLADTRRTEACPSG